jgi:hypothetical protein
MPLSDVKLGMDKIVEQLIAHSNTISRLELIMRIKGMKGIDLAEQTEIHESKISRCFRHPKQYQFDSDEKKRIAETLSVDMGWLFSKEKVSC